MEYFKLNQTVYHPIYGEGKVIKISEHIDYPIKVRFKQGDTCFTKDGRLLKTVPITLSQNPIPEIVNKPLEDESIIKVHCTGNIEEILKNMYNLPIKVDFNTGKSSHTIVTLEMDKKPSEPEYEPFTYEDRELLRNKWIRYKDAKREQIIYTMDTDGVIIGDGIYVKYVTLLQFYKFLDGTPCGKKI